ncbi:MAG: AAA family ATPase, partial [Haliea sp.]
KICGYRIFENFELRPNRNLNLVVGANESGKSTLIEAITLALTGRINGRWASEELNPHWFNMDLVLDFVKKRQAGKRVSLPTIRIELFLENSDDLQPLCGAINSDVPTNACPGISLEVVPDSDYASEIEAWAEQPSSLLPVEYYKVDWRSFADRVLTSRPRQLVTAVIDSRTVRSTSGMDYHLRQILSDQLRPEERAAISLEYREVKAQMSNSVLKRVNKEMAEIHALLHDQPIALAMDQTPRTSWEGAVTPHVRDVPFSMAGQGQQAAIKISLAMSRHSERAGFVMIEEPENHLSFASLSVLLSRMEDLAGKHQQLFVTTHSSFVLNRLGVDALHLLSEGIPQRLSDLSPGTVNYFRKLPGHDTLRMVLADKIVLVEGPSDEIVFERIFQDMYGKRPLQCGIDVLSVRGLSFERCLELCSALDKTVAAVRDNDGYDTDELRKDVEPYLSKARRDIFIGSHECGKTLEPQLIHYNGEEKLRKILGITETADIRKWMARQKTEAALRIASSEESISPPG